LLDDADAATQRTTLGVGTGDSPQFTAVNIGAASDTTISRVSAGVIAVEGDTVATLAAAQTWTGAQTFGDVAASSYKLNSAGIITESGTSRTLSAGDNGKVLYCTSSSAVTITCATGLGAGFSCTIMQAGTGKVTVASGTATLNSYNSLFSTMGQYAIISLISPVADTFVAAGNLGV
jgi:hypothetical protein